MIAGGCVENNDSDPVSVKYLNTIFYAFSDDLNNDDIDNIWLISDVKMPMGVVGCQCVILNDKNTPKLHIIGGQDSSQTPLDLHLQYDLSQIIGEKKCQKLFPGLWQ